ncbi:phosphate propanoyltransferase [Halobacillus yeomjeoni]|uniref:Phosphate propanoyltransferase n=1 Tax=Halobacillus yeomjeoni TaxID=311194 RepID=A0A931HUL6_9BACI|nr:phosphate propanoyltransferase [Halobacillus yeomjeoni]MBH0229714.1 phosphate propanoyltransferase [Halobacillus yeomjeoni]
MSPHNVEEIVQKVMTRIKEEKQTSSEIPVGVSARHCHLDRETFKLLFGDDAELTKKADLSQPDQFAANETITVAGPKGSISKVRILGPLRSSNQVEISQTDAFKVGLKPPIRQSGDISGSCPVTIIGPYGSVYLNEGLIIAQAHIHMHTNDAERYGVEDGNVVSIRFENEKRDVHFSKTVIRVSENYRLEMHIDTDEANAGSIVTGQTGELVKVMADES